jgi:integrase/recombinase XerD
MNDRQRRKMDLHLVRFVEAMTAWNWSKRTIPGYEQNVRVFLDWLERETDVTTLAEVTPETVASYQTALLSMENPRKDGELLSVGTHHARLSIVKGFFRFLASEGKLLLDPAAQVRLPKKRKGLPQALLTPKEAIRMLESIDTTTLLGLRDRAMLEVLYACGIRNAELRALSLPDFDPQAGTLAIRGGKGNKDRYVPLGPVAVAVLSDYIQRARPELLRSRSRSRSARVRGLRDTSILFLSKAGGDLNATAVILAVKKAAKRAGIRKPIRPHRLRHACATHMLQGGADIRHIQKLLGHATLATTQIYTQVEISDLKEVHRRFHPRERGPQGSR